MMKKKTRMKNLSGRKVFATGAASGIGYAIAHQCARSGAVLFLTDVNKAGLDVVATEIANAGGDVAFAAPVDLADQEAVRALCTEMTATHGAMDIIMNVAGIASWGTISAMPTETWRHVIDVNLLGPISIMHHLVPPMIGAGRGGHIVNVSSAAGIIGLPWHGAYSASKFGLRGVSEVLRFDLAKHGIGVSLVCPGGVDTGLTETVQIVGVDQASPAFEALRMRFKRRAVTPEQAAEAVMRGVARGKFWVYTSADIRLAHLCQRYFPAGYAAVMTLVHKIANRALPEVEQASPAMNPARH